jgi:hypothetical protein
LRIVHFPIQTQKSQRKTGKRPQTFAPGTAPNAKKNTFQDTNFLDKSEVVTESSLNTNPRKAPRQNILLELRNPLLVKTTLGTFFA